MGASGAMGVIFVWLFGSFAMAREPGSDLTSGEHLQAEYVRLSEEMASATSRDNWVAVERSFANMEELGLPHKRPVLIQAAHAAMARGEVLAARRRLVEAQKIYEDDETQEWLLRIQEKYGPVTLAADLVANYRITAKQMPFAPEERTAVEFGADTIFSKSYFDGLLPKGEYVFHPYGAEEGDPGAFTFKLRSGRERVDLRTKEEVTRKDRRKRERIDRKIAKREAADQP